VTAQAGRDTDPRLNGGVALIRRTGAQGFQLRFSDDVEPTVWLAVATYAGDRWETAAAQTPLRAVLRLCEQLVDGGMCTHCQRPTGLEPNTLDVMPMDRHVCWFQWDPELETFRAGCGGRRQATGDRPAPDATDTDPASG
jgi:hypothetical protein